MMNHKRRKSITGAVFAVITGGLLVGASMLGAPEASSSSVPSVCETGFTTDADYRAECMSEGTYAHAALAWYHGYSDGQRKADCEWGWRIGSMATVVRETRGDVLTDNFRNGEQVIAWTAEIAVENCVAFGFGDVAE